MIVAKSQPKAVALGTAFLNLFQDRYAGENKHSVSGAGVMDGERGRKRAHPP